jgi:hypothetical protein
MENKKLGVIVPFRDRYEHLYAFKHSIINYLKQRSIPFELIIVEQDDAKSFNRGKLLNIGFVLAKKMKCDYVVFHDIDMLPHEVDYSYSDTPIHLATKFFSKNNEASKIIFDEYFGGVTMFPIDAFERINGYSNEYWGWGYEDNDLLFRCKAARLPLDEKIIKSSVSGTAALRFDKDDSYVRGKNQFNFKKEITFFISFYPDKVFCGIEKYDDTYSIFSIPGFDLRISYNSYNRYNFELYNELKEISYINSDIKSNYKTTICVTIDPTKKIITMHQDGELVNTTHFNSNLYDYSSEPYFYLGQSGQSKAELKNNFRGSISSFAYYDKILSRFEILEISNNKFFGLTSNFKNYKSADDLKLYYDCRIVKNNELVDLCFGNNNGIINNCNLVEYSMEDDKILKIPYRRECLFELLNHDENGYSNGSWKNITTRYNQLKFHNEVETNKLNYKTDGLTTLEYVEHNKTKVGNQTHITVGI